MDPSGENAILLFPGANSSFSEFEILSVLDQADRDDWILVQNETNLVPKIISGAASRRLRIAFNPAPATTDVAEYPIELTELLVLNEGELAKLSGSPSVETGLVRLKNRLPRTRIVVTLGAAGCIYQSADEQIRVDAEQVRAVDTTGAGDTFVGYFLAEYALTADVSRALRLATRAAGYSVTRKGAATSIPVRGELD